MRGASRVLSMWNLPATRPGHFKHVTKLVAHSDFCQDRIIYFQLSVEVIRDCIGFALLCTRKLAPPSQPVRS